MKKIIFSLLLIALLSFTSAAAQTCATNADCETGYKCVDEECTELTTLEKLDYYVGKSVPLEGRVPSAVKNFGGMVLPINILLNVTDKDKVYLVKVAKNFELSISSEGNSHDLEIRAEGDVVEMLGGLTSFDFSMVKDIIEKENIVLHPKSAKAEFLLTQITELFGIKPQIERPKDIISVIVHGFSVVIAKIISFFNSIFNFIPKLT